MRAGASGGRRGGCDWGNFVVWVVTWLLGAVGCARAFWAGCGCGGYLRVAARVRVVCGAYFAALVRDVSKHAPLRGEGEVRGAGRVKRVRDVG